MAPDFRVLQRFMSKILVNPVTDCWEWTAYRQKQGYGCFSYHGIQRLAHRASWELHFGRIPSGKDILHKCDNPPCVNPSHLFIGDDFINQQDRVAKGRHKGVAWDQRGEANKCAKLTDETVFAIRAKYTGKRGEQRIFSKRYGVCQSLISQIVNRKIWTHI